MKAYYYDDQPGDPRAPHLTTPSIPESHLSTLGLLYQHIPVPSSRPASPNPSTPSTTSSHSHSHSHGSTSSSGASAINPQTLSHNPPLATLASERNYTHADTITISPTTMGKVYEDKIKMFFTEHMHEDEEIRYILEGAGFFDVREVGDKRWVRIKVESGDLVVLPAGVFHRFCVDDGDYIKAMRLFKDQPKWTPLNRDESLEENEIRKSYVQQREGALQKEREQGTPAAVEVA